MTGQRCQAPFDEGARGLQLSALACEAGLKEHELWPRQRRIRNKPVEKLLMVRPGQTPHQEGVPLAQVLGPLLSTPTAALLITATLRNPVQRSGTTRSWESTLAREFSRALTQPSPPRVQP